MKLKISKAARFQDSNSSLATQALSAVGPTIHAAAVRVAQSMSAVRFPTFSGTDTGDRQNHEIGSTERANGYPLILTSGGLQVERAFRPTFVELGRFGGLPVKASENIFCICLSLWLQS
ncbi:hypothetical protein SUGI_0214140 [Cryptomeria japonica]|nr:hypothetical protein SUGI_0214140 [Cryptomeria japonica]